MSHRILLALLGAALFASASPALAKSSPDQAQIHMEVPPRLQDKGYKLYLDQELYSVDGTVLTVPDSDDLTDMKLLDRDGRVVAHGDYFVEDSSLSHLRNHAVRVAALFGLDTDANNALKPLLAKTPLSTSLLTVGYQPGRFGIEAGQLRATSDKARVDNLSASYHLTEWRLGATAEWPLLFRRGEPSWLARWSWLGTAGVLSATHEASNSDGHVSVTDHSQAYGGYAGLGLKLLIVQNFRIDGTLTASDSQVKLPAFGFDKQVLNLQQLLGVSYAF